MTTVTIEEVEQLATQLPAAEQLKLLARISTQLSNLGVATLPVNAELERQQREARAEAFLQELDAIAERVALHSIVDIIPTSQSRL